MKKNVIILRNAFLISKDVGHHSRRNNNGEIQSRVSYSKSKRANVPPFLTFIAWHETNRQKQLDRHYFSYISSLYDIFMDGFIYI